MIQTTRIGKLGTFKNKEPKQSSHPEEGTLYLSSTGQTYSQPKIDADLISKYRENKFIREGLDKQQRILFQDDIKITVVDRKTKAVEEDLTDQVVSMCESSNLDFKVQQLWRDSQEWGPGISNPVWEYEGSEYVLKDLRRLDPQSFTYAGNTNYLAVKNRILQGISYNPETKLVECYQKQSNGTITKLENTFLFTDPLTTEVGGTPFIVPIVPFVTMMNFAFSAQMQKVNQYGSGGIWFLKVTNPKGTDKAFAQKIIKNAGKNTAFQLRENMTVESLGVGQNGSALETITELGMQIRQFFSPADIMPDSGGLVGGSNQSEYQLYMSYIKGTHRWLERRVATLLDPWLTVNLYSGYRIVVDIPQPTVDKSAFTLQVLDSAFKNGAIDVSEGRKVYTDLGLDLPEEVPEGVGGTQQQEMLQKADLVIKAIGSNDMDPEHLISESDAKQYLNKALGIKKDADKKTG